MDSLRTSFFSHCRIDASKRIKVGDRFIPWRHPELIEEQHSKLMNGENSNTQKSDYVQQLAQAIFQEPMDSPILHFSNQQKQFQYIPSEKFKPLPIDQRPSRVYGAEGLRDDFYTDLMDMTTNNVGSKLVVSLNEGETIYLADRSGDHLSSIQEICQLSSVTSLRLNSRDNALVVGQANGTISLLDLEAGQLKTSIASSLGRVGTLAVKPEDSFVLAGSRDKSIRHLDFRQKAVVKTYEGHRQEVCSLQLSSNSHIFASGGNDNRFKVWDLRHSSSDHSACLFQERIHASVRAQDFSPTASHLLANGGGTADRTLRIWNISDKKLISEKDTGSQITKLFWSPDGKFITTCHGYSENNIKIWCVDNNRQVHLVNQLVPQQARILHAAQSCDGEYVVAGAAEAIKFWKISLPCERPTKHQESWTQKFNIR